MSPRDDCCRARSTCEQPSSQAESLGLLYTTSITLFRPTMFETADGSGQGSNLEAQGFRKREEAEDTSRSIKCTKREEPTERP